MFRLPALATLCCSVSELTVTVGAGICFNNVKVDRSHNVRDELDYCMYASLAGYASPSLVGYRRCKALFFSTKVLLHLQLFR